MKILNKKLIIVSLGFLLLNSCIVKSLFPFFTKATIHYEKALEGNWIDKENGEWKITSLIKDKKNMSVEELKEIGDYLNGYHIERTHKNIKSNYLAVPFKLNNQLFIDFIPSPENDFKGTPNLVSYHYVTAHSLVKVDINNNIINLKWLDRDKLEKLLNEKKIKIKHVETMDFPNEYLLTASSEELQKFIKKYMASNDENKWSTDVEFNLQRIDAKP